MEVSDYYVQDNSDIENTKVSAAKGLYDKGDYSSALNLYLDIAKTGFSHNICHEIGRCYYKLKDLEHAEWYFQQSIKLESDKNPSYIFMGSIFSTKGQMHEAVENWIRAYSYWPDNESVCFGLATSYFAKQMKFQSVYYYEKYLKHASNKNSAYYNEIKTGIEKLKEGAIELYKKSKLAIDAGDDNMAMQLLLHAIKNYPLNFDVNFLLGKIYYDKENYAQAVIYLKQAYCLDRKSFDVLKLLASALEKSNDLNGSYCCLKRLLPLVINNQVEYYTIIALIKEQETNIGNIHINLQLAQKYYHENNYHFALFEYENVVIIDGVLQEKYREIIHQLKVFLNPEKQVIEACLEKGKVHYTSRDYENSNKYFTRVMSIADKNSPEYKIAQSRITNV